MRQAADDLRRGDVSVRAELDVIRRFLDQLGERCDERCSATNNNNMVKISTHEQHAIAAV